MKEEVQIMLNKKTFLSVLIIGVVGVLAGSATWAYFQDTELSDDNTITAGTLDLYLDPATSPYTSATLFVDGIEPEDDSNTYQSIENVGTLDGELDITLNGLQNIESVVSGDNTEFLGDLIGGSGVGELGGEVEMAIWVDLDHDGTFDSGTDISLESDGTTATDDNSGAYYFDTLNDYFGTGSQTWDEVVSDMDPDDEYYVHILWTLPFGSAADNTIQGDTVKFDIVYTLEQDAVDP